MTIPDDGLEAVTFSDFERRLAFWKIFESDNGHPSFRHFDYDDDRENITVMAIDGKSMIQAPSIRHTLKRIGKEPYEWIALAKPNGP